MKLNQKLKKFSKGSVLVYSLIIMFVMLSIVLSMSAVSIKDRNNAGTTGKSVQAFQAANSGSELFAKSMKDAPANISGIATGTNGLTCTGGKIIGGSASAGGTFSIELYDGTNPTPLLCTSTANVATVAKIKSTGFFGGTSRAIEVAIKLGDIAKATSDLNAIADVIKTVRNIISGVTMDVTENGCSDCVCRPASMLGPAPDDLRNLPASDNCYITWIASLGIIESKVVPALPFGTLTNAYARDPWGSPYLLDENEHEFSPIDCRLDMLRSVGPDGELGTADDIVITISHFICP